ncbi:MAG: hypothetical protein HW410_1573 [Nitrosarchaeum sp.]|nr:hypothetical protein [Nitrosarchaeum sp.]
MRHDNNYYSIVKIYKNYFFFKSRIIRRTIHSDAIAIVPTPRPTKKGSVVLNWVRPTPNTINITAIMFCLLTIKKHNIDKLIKLPIELQRIFIKLKKFLVYLSADKK